MYYYACNVKYWEKSSHKTTSKQTDVNVWLNDKGLLYTVNSFVDFGPRFTR